MAANLRSAAFVAVLVALAAQHAAAFYSDSGPVVNLSPSNLKNKIKANSVWLVEFYAPWCGHCKSLKPDWEKAGKALDGIMGVGAIDCDTHKQLAGEYGVQGFPTIKLLTSDAKGRVSAVADYSGQRSASAIVEWALGQAKKIALKRIGAKASAGSGGGGRGGSGGGGGGGGGGGDNFYGGTDVVMLDEGSFESEVLESEDLWFIEMFAPWCGHCKALKPAWIELASQVKGKVRVGAVDCTAEQGLCGQLGAQGYPTIKFFGTNKRRPVDYQGGRDAGELATYALAEWAKHAPPPEVRELTDHQVFVNECLGHDEDTSIDLEKLPSKQLCFIAFLPNILDDKAVGRNKHIKVLKGLAEKFKDRPFSYMWAEGGAQPALEANFEVGGYGYPAFIAFSPSREKYASARSAFNAKNAKEFVDSVRQGFERVLPLRGQVASLESRNPWDGGDGQEIVEEEFDLADLMGDDGDKAEL